MDREQVRDWMTPEPITISPRTTLPEARKLLDEHHIRRLPVVDQGRLVGIVTLGDVREAGASNVSMLSVFDLNYLLAELMIERIMTREPITVGPDASLASAARLMLDHKIGALPVLSGDRLVGIITESDIFRALAQPPSERSNRLAPPASVSQNASRARYTIN